MFFSFSRSSKEHDLQVCTDCREMVLQVVRADRTARRFQLTQSIFDQKNSYAREEVF